VAGTGPRRWPRYVYDEGDEPDPRFSFANERTFLAWIRTALALVVVGMAIQALGGGLPGPARRAVAVVFVALGIGCAVLALVRWTASERALRRSRPLPGMSPGLLLVTGVVVGATALLLLAIQT
jgi:putative membrane protein